MSEHPTSATAFSGLFPKGDKQSKALRLAELMDCLTVNSMKITILDEAAAELRRLHEVNAELVEALRPIAEHGEISAKIIEAARAAIAKATGEQQ